MVWMGKCINSRHHEPNEEYYVGDGRAKEADAWANARSGYASVYKGLAEGFTGLVWVVAKAKSKKQEDTNQSLV